LFTIFSSEEATTAVNIIVILAFFAFLIYIILFILKKLKPEVIEDSFTKNLNTSSAYQNIFAFTSVVLASTLFELFTDAKYRMIWVVVIISITTIVFHILYDKISKTNDSKKIYTEYDEHLTLIEKIMQCKGYNLILNASKLETIENKSEEIYLFTENLITDIPKEKIKNVHSSWENIGLFSDIVKTNIPNNKKYTYFLKNTIENIEHIKEYYSYHFVLEENLKYTKNINFYLVDIIDFTFFTELYLYKDDEIQDKAFEWLPALGEVNKSDKQFYLELSSEQVQHINEIIIELKTTCELYNYDKFKKEVS